MVDFAKLAAEARHDRAQKALAKHVDDPFGGVDAPPPELPASPPWPVDGPKVEEPKKERGITDPHPSLWGRIQHAALNRKPITLTNDDAFEIFQLLQRAQAANKLLWIFVDPKHEKASATTTHAALDAVLAKLRTEP